MSFLSCACASWLIAGLSPAPSCCVSLCCLFLSREEYAALFSFLRNKELNIVSQFEAGMMVGATGRNRLAPNYDEEHDPHLQNIHNAVGSESEDEEDSDFEGGGSSSESSSSDSDMPDEVSDEEDAKPKKKKGGKKHAAAGSDEDEEEGGGKKGQKRKRGEGKTARKPQAKSAYFLFLDDARPKLFAEHPEMKSDVAKTMQVLAGQWRELSEEDRQPYQEKHLAEKKRLAEEAGEPEKAPKAAAKKKSNNPNKRAPAPFTLFSEKRKGELKKEDPSLSAADIKTKLRTEWDGMSEEDKQPYVEENLSLKKQYKQEYEEWLRTHPQGKEGEEGEEGGAEEAASTAVKMEEGSGGEEDEASAKKKKKDKKKEKKHKKEKKKKKGQSYTHTHAFRRLVLQWKRRMGKGQITHLLLLCILPFSFCRVSFGCLCCCCFSVDKKKDRNDREEAGSTAGSEDEADHEMATGDSQEETAIKSEPMEE